MGEGKWGWNVLDDGFEGAGSERVEVDADANSGIGHLLVATREHRVKVEDMKGDEGREIGKFTS